MDYLHGLLLSNHGKRAFAGSIDMNVGEVSAERYLDLR